MPPLSTHLRVGNITAATTLTDTLSPTATYKIVLLLMALPIPFGIGDMAKGTINNTTVDILDTTVSGGSFWACQITAYDSMQFDKLTRLANNDGLGKVSARLIIPRLTSGQAWGTLPVTRVFGVGDNKEDKAHTALDALTARLAKIKSNLSQSTVTNNQAHLPCNPDLHSCLDKFQVPTPIPCRLPPGATTTMTKDATIKEASLNDCLRD